MVIEKLWDTLSERGIRAVLLTDSTEAFNCLPHDLSIAKLHGYLPELSSPNENRESDWTAIKDCGQTFCLELYENLSFGLYHSICSSAINFSVNLILRL